MDNPEKYIGKLSTVMIDRNGKMSLPTKAVNLTEAEIKILIGNLGYQLNNATLKNHDDIIERLGYLNKRLNSFKEPEMTVEKTSNDGWSKPNA